MQGEFRGDFTRNTASNKAFWRVLMQQGRVQLDADWNEQVDILLRYVQGLGQDLMGFHAGRGPGFSIQTIDNTVDDFAIAPGRYYVDGIPCEQAGSLDAKNNPQAWRYTNQPFYTVPANATLDDLRESFNNGPLLAYLDVWERHISFIEDYDLATPGIREVALGGPDTATRAQIVWQVKVIPAAPIDEVLPRPEAQRTDPRYEASTPADELPVQFRYLTRASFHEYLQKSDVELKSGNGRLMARVDNQKTETDPCRISPKSKYRGLENRLYRVEIISHDEETATFVWSRHNSAIMFPILKADSGDNTVTVFLEHLGQDARYSLTEGDWVELVSDRWVLNHAPRVLLQVDAIDTYERSVVLKRPTTTAEFSLDSLNDAGQHPYLRRWDSPGSIPVSLPTVNDGWLALEDGIEVKFIDTQPDNESPQPYQTGDYWLIPARTITGDIEWPKVSGSHTPQALPPHGVMHYYAPLGILSFNDETLEVNDCRRQLQPLWRSSDELA